MDEKTREAILDIGKYETMTPEEAWRDYLWGAEAEDIVWYLDLGEVWSFVSKTDPSYISDDAKDGFWCEIEEAEDGMIGQGCGETWDEAVRNALASPVA